MSSEVRELVRTYVPEFSLRNCGKLYEDTTEFMDIDYGDVMKLGKYHYLVMKNEAERRFGLEDPKYWVKRCREMETGERKIVKLEFYENFPMQVGRLGVDCYRSPDKESRILDKVRGDNRFMQGFTVRDKAGRNARILDIVQGRRLDVMVGNIDLPHEEYFYTVLPELLEKFLHAMQAIADLHAMDERHGDVRRDHLYVEFRSDTWCWIDFDYTFRSYEHPFGLDIFGLGNIVVFLTGQANVTLQLLPSLKLPQERKESITSDDLSIVIPNRIVNLQKLYPYIPDALNRVLMHFSAGNDVYYMSVEEMQNDVREALEALRVLAR